LLIGQEAFADLLIRLPDSFYCLFPEAKEWVWDELMSAVNQGIEDPLTLADIAEKLITGEPVSIVGAGQLSSGSPSLPGVGLACSGDEFTNQMAKKLGEEHGDEPVFEVSL
jgi:hypothetical protein